MRYSRHYWNWNSDAAVRFILASTVAVQNDTNQNIMKEFLVLNSLEQQRTVDKFAFASQIEGDLVFRLNVVCTCSYMLELTLPKLQMKTVALFWKDKSDESPVNSFPDWNI